MAPEWQAKRSTPRARLIRRSCWVSIEGLLNTFWRVRVVMPMRSASHWLVWPERRSSSRMMWPMCICIVVADCALGYRIPIYIPTTTDKKEGEQSRLQSAVVGITFYG